ncbi:MAG: 23S rRNA (uracil(1939)-C(5))-methyltransferase RlmD [Candidatus Omnitrophica bacterium]|nr:23S rRNA (uracil(1939)-C(5))-methyltransferase RlmD [Candidatus Omnitrophota bacterium]
MDREITQCRHFGVCGGCRWQDVPYCGQLIRKRQYVQDLFREAGFSCAVPPVAPSPQWYYRNKMEFTFAQEGGRVTCGFYHRTKKRTVVDLSECKIFSPDAGPILETVKEFVREKGYPAYNKYTHQGFLRNLIVRETKRGKELMVGIVTTGQGKLDAGGFVNALRRCGTRGRVVSVYQVKNDSWSDAVVFEQKELLFGDAMITEEILGMKFHVGIDSFFQVNPAAAECFYRRIRERVSGSGDGTAQVLDLFCGAGGIGLVIAPHVGRVHGVEVQEAIVDAARKNARENGVRNISFTVFDTRRFLSFHGREYRGADYVVLNPPRNGISKKIARGVLRLESPAIIYSSCNARTLVRDLSWLRDWYRIDWVVPVDLFPHTPHLECVAALSKTAEEIDL